MKAGIGQEQQASARRVTVFGSSLPRPEDPAYQEAQELGRLLGKMGYAVQTGGYKGTMEAVSRGASEAGGHVIGITCAEIEAWRPVQCNQWVIEERRFPSLRLRLFALVDDCDAAVALPGGPGTLTEIATLWNHLLTGAIAPRPLILVGPGWQTTFEAFFQSLGQYVPDGQRKWLSFAPSVQSAFEILQSQLESR